MDEVAKVPDKAPTYLLAAADAAVLWWRERKPHGWGVSQHIENPTVNCATEREKRLARAAARWYLIQRSSARGEPNG